MSKVEQLKKRSYSEVKDEEAKSQLSDEEEGEDEIQESGEMTIQEDGTLKQKQKRRSKNDV